MKNKIPCFFTFTLSLLLLLSGCDFTDRRAIDRERADSIYKDAMADYTAGRVDKAIEGLERVVRAAPGNSSARFQLACLLQDNRKDYLGAICNYREFIAQDRSGDKSSLARDRMAQCERLLGPALVKKFDIGGNASLTSENSGLKAKVEALEKTNADLEKRLQKAIARISESASETERMRRMLLSEPAEDATKPVIKTETALLDEEEDNPEDRIKFSQDAKNLVLEEEKEKVDSPFGVTERKERPQEKKDEEPPHEPRPPEYIVKEGDTLFRLAVRFYGRRSAWTLIRDANKATVSTDGHIKAGQRLVFPNP